MVKIAHVLQALLSIFISAEKRMAIWVHGLEKLQKAEVSNFIWIIYAIVCKVALLG